MGYEGKIHPGWGQLLNGVSALKTGPGALVAKEWERWIGENVNQLSRARGVGRHVLNGLERSGALQAIAERVSELTPDTQEVKALKQRISDLEAMVDRLNTHQE